jgi:hypothetical protein
MSDTMKEYTVRYTWGAHVYESKVRAVSSGSALVWAEAAGFYNAKIVAIDGINT